MNLKTLTLGAYQTNCYLLSNGTDAVVIDPGYEPDTILDALEGLTLKAILLTHGHFDHVGGVKQLAAETGCKVYICAEELNMPSRLAGGGIYHTDTYKDGDVLHLAGLEWKVLQTPGHTPGGVCLLCGDALFSGDTLFAGTCGRTDLPGGDYQTIRKSLQKLAALEGNLQVLPGHGPASNLELERRLNPYMQESLW